MKWFGLLVVCVLVAGSWLLLARTGERIGELEKRIDVLLESGDEDSRIPELKSEIQILEGRRTINGAILATAGATFLGILFVSFVLPNWASRVSQSVYGSNAELDDPAVYQEARALLAKGDYVEAIGVFREAVKEEPANRLPWLEIARIYSRHLDQPKEGIAALNEALAARDWPDEDRAFFIFRLAELYHEDPNGREQAVSALMRVIREFPDSRHAMNAKHRLKDWGVG